MKSVSPALASLLATGQYISAELWTFTLNGGAVVRWSGAEVPVTYGGNTWARGPGLTRNGITEKAGVDVAELEVEIIAGATDLIAGQPVIPFIAAHGLDGATVRLDRVYAPNWASPWTGSINRFAGKVTAVKSLKGGKATVTVSSWMLLLNTNLPRNLAQAGCLNSLYDSVCGLNPASFSAAGTVSAATTPSVGAFSVSGFSPASGYYSLGRIVFTSGTMAGLSRTIRSNDGAGNFTLVAPLPHAPAVGDGFTVYAGCDRLQSTCSTKFNNLANGTSGGFRATPYVPQPTTAIGSPAVSTSQRTGK